MPGFSNAQLVEPGDVANLPSGVRFINQAGWKHKLLFEQESVIVPFRLGDMNIKPSGDLEYKLRRGVYRTIDTVTSGERVINTPSREVARSFGSTQNPLLATSGTTKKVLDILLRIAADDSLGADVRSIFQQLESMRVNERNEAEMEKANTLAGQKLPWFYSALRIEPCAQDTLDAVSWLDNNPNYHRGWTLHALLNLVDKKR